MNRQSYEQSLSDLCQSYGDVVTAALHMPFGSLSPAELGTVIDHTLGADLRRVHRINGSLGLRDVGQALRKLPRQQRHTLVLKALDWDAQRPLAFQQLVPLDKTAQPSKSALRPAVEQAFQQHRRAAAAHSLRQIIRNQVQLTDALTEVVWDLQLMEWVESPRETIQAHCRTIRGLFRSSEWHARMAILWALRNGLVPERVVDSLVRIYIRPILRIADDMQSVENRLGLKDDQRPSGTARKSAFRLERELVETLRYSHQSGQVRRRGIAEIPATP